MPNKFSLSQRKYLTLLAVFFLLISVFITLYLVRRSQDVRKRAAGTGEIQVVLQPASGSLNIGSNTNIIVSLNNTTNEPVALNVADIALNLDSSYFDVSNIVCNQEGLSVPVSAKYNTADAANILSLTCSIEGGSENIILDANASLQLGSFDVMPKESVNSAAISFIYTNIPDPLSPEYEDISDSGTDGIFSVPENPADTPTPSPTPSPDYSDALRVFVTSQKYSGNLGGLAGADLKCQQSADNANLGGSWIAWLSDSSTDAKDRFIYTDRPFIRMDGLPVADSLNDIIDCDANSPTDNNCLKNNIGIDENGAVADVLVWTETHFSGEKARTTGDNFCSNWTRDNHDSSDLEVIGYSTSKIYQWTDSLQNDFASGCDINNALYCFEQTESLISPTNTPTPTPSCSVQQPQVSILAPDDGAVFNEGESVILQTQMQFNTCNSTRRSYIFIMDQTVQGNWIEICVNNSSTDGISTCEFDGKISGHRYAWYPIVMNESYLDTDDSRIFSINSSVFPTPTATLTPTPTVTNTPTPTVTNTPTPTVTLTPTPSSTPSLTPILTLTPTPTGSITPSLTITPSPMPSCPEDGDLGNLNCDAGGLINETDLLILLDNWCPQTNCPAVPTPIAGFWSADITGDDFVDESDILKMLDNWHPVE